MSRWSPFKSIALTIVEKNERGISSYLKCDLRSGRVSTFLLRLKLYPRRVNKKHSRLTLVQMCKEASIDNTNLYWCLPDVTVSQLPCCYWWETHQHTATSTQWKHLLQLQTLVLWADDAIYQLHVIHDIITRYMASDSRIFTQSELKRALDHGLLTIPTAKPKPGSAPEALILTLTPSLFRPNEAVSFPNGMKLFNYRLS